MSRDPVRSFDRFRGLGDPTGWALILIACLPLLFIDPAMLMTLVQWTSFTLALSGMAVLVSRVILPQIDLTYWVKRAREDATGLTAGLVVLAIALVWSVIFFGLITWAKT